MKNVLLVPHDFTHTGAPALLLRLRRLIYEMFPDITVDISCIYERGSLKDEFLKTGVFYWGPLKKLGFFRKRKLLSTNYDLIVTSTILAGEVVELLSQNGSPIITWLNEREHVINEYGLELFSTIIKYSQVIMTDAEETRQLVASKHKNVFLLRGFVNTLESRQDLEVKLNQNNQENLQVLLVSSASWIKGSYDIPLLIKSLSSLPITIHWVGAEINNKIVMQVLEDLKKNKLQEKLVIHGFQKEMSPYFKNADVLLCLSHVEAGPLTILEAAQYGVPAICWRNSIGLEDFVNKESGWVIDFQDFGAMRLLFEKLVYNKREIEEKGSNAQDQVQSDFSSEKRKIEFQQILNLINAL